MVPSTSKATNVTIGTEIRINRFRFFIKISFLLCAVLRKNGYELVLCLTFSLYQTPELPQRFHQGMLFKTLPCYSPIRIRVSSNSNRSPKGWPSALVTGSRVPSRGS